jgi:hypothetical protein
MCRDTSAYGADTDGFRPERWGTLNTGSAPQGFTTSNTQEFGSPAFGFGRRVCPGQHMAYRSLFIMCANMLATMNIAPVVDTQGKPILPEVAYAGGVITYAVLYSKISCMLTCGLKPSEAAQGKDHAFIRQGS